MFQYQTRTRIFPFQLCQRILKLSFLAQFFLGCHLSESWENSLDTCFLPDHQSPTSLSSLLQRRVDCKTSEDWWFFSYKYAVYSAKVLSLQTKGKAADKSRLWAEYFAHLLKVKTALGWSFYFTPGSDKSLTYLDMFCTSQGIAWHHLPQLWQVIYMSLALLLSLVLLLFLVAQLSLELQTSKSPRVP